VDRHKCLVIAKHKLNHLLPTCKDMAKKSKFEIAVIDKVKQLRMEKNLTQDDLAAILNSSRGFIGQVESPNSPSKYNLNHLNKLALELGCSPKTFLPEKPILESGRVKKRG
jgi:DNA-binding XRE family transcriptional regulator